MADGLGLVHDSGVRLVVGASAPSGTVRTSGVEQELGEVEETRVSGRAVELDQSHLGDLVARPDRFLARPEGPHEQLRAPERDVQERLLARRLIVGHGGLVEVAEVVQLVAVDLLQLPAPRAGPGVGLLGVDRARGVKITVRLLRVGDLVDQAVEVGVELRVRMNAERVGGSLDDLVQVTVVERVARRLSVPERLAAQRGGGALEVADAAGLLALGEGERDRDGPVGFDAGRPECVAQMHGGEGHRLDGIVPRRFLLLSRRDADERQRLHSCDVVIAFLVQQPHFLEVEGVGRGRNLIGRLRPGSLPGSEDADRGAEQQDDGFLHFRGLLGHQDVKK